MKINESNQKRFAVDFYREERRQEILKHIHQNGRASVSELSGQFGVSEVTIRSDLQVLEQLGLILRTHGGAIPNSPELADLALTHRLEKQMSEKTRIGEAGAALIADGETIFLDSSSTALAIAGRLKARRELTILTNSLAVAQELMDARAISVVLTGGLLQRDTASLVGAAGVDLLKNFDIQKGFFGAHGISLPEGLTDISETEALTKRALAARCAELIAILDATKWGRVGLASFAGLAQVKHIVSTREAPSGLVQAVRQRGIEVTLV